MVSLLGYYGGIGYDPGGHLRRYGTGGEVMAYIKPVINEACKQAQARRLESQTSCSKITLEQAIAQTRFILEHTGDDKISPKNSKGSPQ